jgi:hypothetical protein
MLLPLGVFKGKLLYEWLLRGKASTGRRLLGNYFHLWKSEANLAEPRPQNDRSHKSKDSAVSGYLVVTKRTTESGSITPDRPDAEQPSGN